MAETMKPARGGDLGTGFGMALAGKRCGSEHSADSREFEASHLDRVTVFVARRCRLAPATAAAVAALAFPNVTGRAWQ